MDKLQIVKMILAPKEPIPWHSISFKDFRYDYTDYKLLCKNGYDYSSIIILIQDYIILNKNNISSKFFREFNLWRIKKMKSLDVIRITGKGAMVHNGHRILPSKKQNRKLKNRKLK